MKNQILPKVSKSNRLFSWLTNIDFNQPPNESCSNKDPFIYSDHNFEYFSNISRGSLR